MNQRHLLAAFALLTTAVGSIAAAWWTGQHSLGLMGAVFALLAASLLLFQSESRDELDDSQAQLRAPTDTQS